MRIYFDACALSRLTDDRKQERVASEAEAVEKIFKSIYLQQVEWSASTSLFRELSRNPDEKKRNDTLALLSCAKTLNEPADSVKARAQALHRLGYGAFDALHIAHAEHDQADFLLTTDDRLIHRAMRGIGNLAVEIINPVDWIRR